MTENLLIIIYRIFFIALIIFVFFFFLKIKKNDFQLSSFFKDYTGITSLAIILVHGLIPLLQDVFPSYYRLSTYYSFSEKFYASIFVLIFYLSFLISNLAFSQFRKKSSPISCSLSETIFGSKVFFANFLFLFLPSLVSIIFIANLINSINISELLVNRISLFRGLGPILLLSNVLSFIAVIFFARFYMKGKFKDILLYFVFFITMVVVYTVTGSRNSLFVFLLLNLIVFYRIGGNLSLLKFSVISSSALFFFTVVGFFRVRSTDIDQFEIIGLLAENVTHSLVSVFGTDEILIFLISNNFSDFQFGKTFIASITNFVPRFFWPDKPLGAGPLLTNFINPGSYELGLSNVSSYTTGLVAEAYMNFGWFSLLIVPIIFSFFGLLIDVIRFKSFHNLILHSYLSLMFAFAVFYSEFLGLFSRAIYVCLPLLMCIVFLNIFSKSRRGI